MPVNRDCRGSTPREREAGDPREKAAKEHALCEAQVLQAGEGRQRREEGAHCGQRGAEQVAQRLQPRVLPELRRCYALCSVVQHLQLGALAHCMHPHSSFFSLP